MSTCRINEGDPGRKCRISSYFPFVSKMKMLMNAIRSDSLLWFEGILMCPKKELAVVFIDLYNVTRAFSLTSKVLLTLFISASCSVIPGSWFSLTPLVLYLEVGEL